MRSGLSIREFCRQRKLHESQSHRWQRHLAINPAHAGGLGGLAHAAQAGTAVKNGVGLTDTVQTERRRPVSYSFASFPRHFQQTKTMRTAFAAEIETNTADINRSSDRSLAASLSQTSRFAAVLAETYRARAAAAGALWTGIRRPKTPLSSAASSINNRTAVASRYPIRLIWPMPPVTVTRRWTSDFP